MDSLAIFIVAVFVAIVVGGVVTFSMLMRAQAKRKAAPKATQAEEPDPEDLGGLPAEELARRYRRENELSVLTAYVEAITPELGEGTGAVVTRANDRQVEWRGRVDDHDARVRFDSHSATIELEQAEDAPGFCLEHDKDKAQEDEPEAWGEDDSMRVFVGEAVFLEGRWVFLEDELRAWGSLDPELRVELVEALHSAQAQRLRSNAGLVTVDVYEPYRKPRQTLRRVREALAAAAKLAAVAGRPLPAEAPTGPLNLGRRTCNYCRKQFIEGPDLRCPNCGAPVEGTA